MTIEIKYNIGDKVLLENGRIETISSIILGDGKEPKYHFERLFQSYRWESQIVKCYDSIT